MSQIKETKPNLGRLQSLLKESRTSPPFQVDLCKHSYAQVHTWLTEAASQRSALVSHVLASPTDAGVISPFSGPGVANFIAAHLSDLLHTLPLEVLSKLQQDQVLAKACSASREILAAVTCKRTTVTFTDTEGRQVHLEDNITLAELARYPRSLVLDMKTAKLISTINGPNYDKLRSELERIMEKNPPAGLLNDLVPVLPHITQMRVDSDGLAYTLHEFEAYYGCPNPDVWGISSEVVFWEDLFWTFSRNNGWIKVTTNMRVGPVDWTPRDHETNSEPDEDETNLDKIMLWFEGNVITPSLEAIFGADRATPLAQLRYRGSDSKTISSVNYDAFEQALQQQTTGAAESAPTLTRTHQQNEMYDQLHPQVRRILNEHASHQSVVFELFKVFAGPCVMTMKEPTLPSRDDVKLEDLTGTPTVAFNVSLGLREQLQSTTATEYMRTRLLEMSKLHLQANPSGNEIIAAGTYYTSEALELYRRFGETFAKGDIAHIVERLDKGIVSLKASTLMQNIKVRLGRITESAFEVLRSGHQDAATTAKTSYGMISMLIYELQEIGRTLALAEAQQQSHLSSTSTQHKSKSHVQSISKSDDSARPNSTAFTSTPNLPSQTSIHINQSVRGSDGSTGSAGGTMSDQDGAAKIKGTAPNGVVCPFEWATPYDKMVKGRICRFGDNCKDAHLHGTEWEDIDEETREQLRCPQCEKHRCPFAFNTRAPCKQNEKKGARPNGGKGGTRSDKSSATAARSEKALKKKLRSAEADVASLLNRVDSPTSMSEEETATTPTPTTTTLATSTTDTPSDSVLEAIRKRALGRSSDKSTKKRTSKKSKP
jgi:hypothetical protein